MTCCNIRRNVLRVVILIIPLFLLSAAAQAAQKHRANVRPANAKSLTVTVQGKERLYYELDKSQDMSITLEGPGKLTILSRLIFPAQSSGTQKYSLEIHEGNQIVKSYSTTTDRSKASIKGSESVPGRSRKSSLAVPRGTHIYTFRLTESSLNGVCLRFVFDTAVTAGKSASLAPLSYFRVTSALINEKPVSFFVATPKHNVNLRVVGPTTITVTSRLNFSDKMKGEQKYALVVSENGKHLLTKPLLTAKSLGLEYQDWKEVVPGQSQAFSMRVPAGEHTYSFNLAESLAQSVSLHFALPARDVTNGK